MLNHALQAPPIFISYTFVFLALTGAVEDVSVWIGSSTFKKSPKEFQSAWMSGDQRMLKADKRAGKQSGRQGRKQASRQASKQASRQAGNQAGKLAGKQESTYGAFSRSHAL